MNFSIHQRLEQIILLVKHFFIYFLYIISIKINVKRLIDFLIATILCNLSFAEYSDIPAELWAINIITADTNLNKIKENIDFIWHASENFSGKLYALNMLKKIGSEAEFKKRFDSLDKNIKFTRISGCIIDNNTTLATIKNEYIFNIKQSYNRHYLKFPNMPYPRDKNGRPFLLNKPNIVFHETNIEETKLDFLPMRFVTNGDGLLHGEGLGKLAAEWLDEENPHTRESLESLLRFLPQNANRMLAYYSSNVAVFAVKENNTYRFTKIENPKIGSEPCFDEQYLSATPCRKLAQKIFDILARREFSNPKIKNFDTPFHFLFLKANMVAEEIAFPQNRLTKDFIATIKSKLKENSATPIKICAALSKFGADNNPSLWIFPIYADSLKEKLDTIKNRHIEILNSLSEQELKSYSDFVAEKKFPLYWIYKKRVPIGTRQNLKSIFRLSALGDCLLQRICRIHQRLRFLRPKFEFDMFYYSV